MHWGSSFRLRLLGCDTDRRLPSLPELPSTPRTPPRPDRRHVVAHLAQAPPPQRRDRHDTEPQMVAQSMPPGRAMYATTRACILARRTAQQGPEPPARNAPCAKAPLEAASPGTAGCQTCTGALGCQARGVGCAAQAPGAHGPAAHCMAPMAMGCRPCVGCSICGCCWLSTQGSGCCPPWRPAQVCGLLSTLPLRDAQIRPGPREPTRPRRSSTPRRQGPLKATTKARRQRRRATAAAGHCAARQSPGAGWGCPTHVA